ncbi:MAG: hypothetical protein ACHQM6_08665, partial [Candidatus Kapaibacterium sp.]
MSRRKELLLLFLGDFIAINGAWVLFRWVRFYSGWFAKATEPFDISDVYRSIVIIDVMWLIAFLFFGLYRTWYVRPIFDEIVTIIKTILFGTLAFFFFFWWEPFSNIEKPLRNDPRLLGIIFFLIT